VPVQALYVSEKWLTIHPPLIEFYYTTGKKRILADEK